MDHTKCVAKTNTVMLNICINNQNYYYNIIPVSIFEGGYCKTVLREGMRILKLSVNFGKDWKRQKRIPHSGGPISDLRRPIHLNFFLKLMSRTIPSCSASLFGPQMSQKVWVHGDSPGGSL